MGNNKRCPVSKEFFEKCCIAAARHIFDKDWTFRDAHPELEERYWYYGDPADTIYFIRELDPDLQCNYTYQIMAALCRYTPPTFKRYAQKYLWPEKYGELPEDFYDGGDDRYKLRVKNYEKEGGGQHWAGYSETRAIVEYELEEEEQHRVKDVSELPRLD